MTDQEIARNVRAVAHAVGQQEFEGLADEDDDQDAGASGRPP